MWLKLFVNKSRYAVKTQSPRTAVSVPQHTTLPEISTPRGSLWGEGSTARKTAANLDHCLWNKPSRDRVCQEGRVCSCQGCDKSKCSLGNICIKFHKLVPHFQFSDRDFKGLSGPIWDHLLVCEKPNTIQYSGFGEGVSRKKFRMNNNDFIYFLRQKSTNSQLSLPYVERTSSGSITNGSKINLAKLFLDFFPSLTISLMKRISSPKRWDLRRMGNLKYGL